MDTAETVRIISENFKAWARLTKEEQDGMLASTVLMRYPKGASIHNGENDCKGMLIIKKGMLRIYMLSESGKEITLYRLSAGDVCILSASCVLSAITFEVQIDAEEDSEMFFTSPNFLQHLMEQNIYVECFAYKTATDRFSDVMWAMQQILFMSMDKRLAVFPVGRDHENGGRHGVHLTHEQVARGRGQRPGGRHQDAQVLFLGGHRRALPGRHQDRRPEKATQAGGIDIMD